MKGKYFQLVLCMCLCLFLAAMTVPARADNCDTDEILSQIEKKEHGVSGDRDMSSLRIQEVRETTDVPVTGDSVKDTDLKEKDPQ